MRRRGRIENFNIQEVENLKIKEQEKNREMEEHIKEMKKILKMNEEEKTDRVNWNDKEFRRNTMKEYIGEKLKKENKQAVKDERRRKNR